MAELFGLDGQRLTNQEVPRQQPFLDLDEGDKLYRVPVVVIAEGQLHQLADMVAERILPELLPLLHEQLELPL